MAEEPNALPLAHVVLCSTGLTPDQRTELTAKASVMGAQVGMDFTTSTTHLVVTNSSSPKYKFVAKNRADVVVVDLDWVNEMHALWTAGEDVDVRDMEEKHKLPAFFGLKVCVTMFLDDERAEIIEMLTDNGAEYYPDLTKDVTHLIAPEARGKKYHFARKWKIQICGPEWIRDSIERGMILDEASYDLRLPVEKRGIGARPEPPKPAPVVEEGGMKAPTGNMLPPDASASSTVPAGSMTRKLRRTASSKFGSQADDLWKEIMGSGPAPKEKKRDVWEDDSQQDQIPAFEDAADTSANTFNLNRHGQHAVAQPNTKTGLLANRAFYLLGFPMNQAGILQETIESLDGTVHLVLSEFFEAAKDSKDAAFMLIPPEMGRMKCPEIPEDCNIDILRYWWLEVCMLEKKLLNPDDFGRGLVYRPYSTGKIPSFEKMKITITGFTGSELLHLGKFLELVGAKYTQHLKQGETTLVIKNPTSPIDMTTKGGKLDAAQIWNIPVVDLDWLWDCVEQGKHLPLSDYLVKLPMKRKRYEESEETIADESSKRRNHSQTNVRQHDPSEVRTVRQSSLRRSDAGQPSDRLGEAAANGGESESNGKEQTGTKTNRKSVLDGSIICISRTLKHRMVELAEIAELLGAKVVNCFTAKDIRPITHLIHKSPQLNDRTQDYRTAKQIKGCKVVSPEWLQGCRKYRKRLDEEAYPPIIAEAGCLTLTKVAPEYTSPVKQSSRLPLVPTNRMPKKSELNIVPASVDKMDVDWEYQSAPKQRTPTPPAPPQSPPTLQEEAPPPVLQPELLPKSSATLGRQSESPESPAEEAPVQPRLTSYPISPARPKPSARERTKTPSPRKPNPIASLLKNLTAPQILSLVDDPAPEPPRRKFSGRSLSTLSTLSSTTSSFSNLNGAPPQPPPMTAAVEPIRRRIADSVDGSEDELDELETESTQCRVTYGDDPQAIVERQKIYEALSGKKVQEDRVGKVAEDGVTVKVQDLRRKRQVTRRL